MKLSLLFLICLLFLACNKQEETSEPSPVEETKPIDVEKINEKEKPDGGVDAGAPDPFRNHFMLSSDIPEDELNVFLEHLKSRVQEINLREREVIQREQMVASLEASALEQVEVLWKLKSQVAVLLEKVGDDFKDERKAYENKIKKREAKQKEIEKKAAVERQQKADEMRRVSEEMTEERERRIVHLTATIKGMRASAGAGMLASMDEADAVAILRQLGSRQAAALLGGMPADKAAHLAEAMLGPKPISPELLEKKDKQNGLEEEK